MNISAGVPHRILGKVGPGKYRIEHPENCGCQYLLSPKAATWVSYDMLHGHITCNRCHVVQDLPCPVYRPRVWARVGYPDIDAISYDLKTFAGFHENCLEPDKPETESPSQRRCLRCQTLLPLDRRTNVRYCDDRCGERQRNARAYQKRKSRQGEILPKSETPLDGASLEV